jgi:hypothetical protein
MHVFSAAPTWVEIEGPAAGAVERQHANRGGTHQLGRQEANRRVAPAERDAVTDDTEQVYAPSDQGGFGQEAPALSVLKRSGSVHGFLFSNR